MGVHSTAKVTISNKRASAKRKINTQFFKVTHSGCSAGAPCSKRSQNSAKDEKSKIWSLVRENATYKHFYSLSVHGSVVIEHSCIRGNGTTRATAYPHEDCALMEAQVLAKKKLDSLYYESDAACKCKIKHSPVSSPSPKSRKSTVQPIAAGLSITAVPIVGDQQYKEAHDYIAGKNGVKKDIRKGSALLEQAANMGNPRAVVEVGVCLLRGGYFMKMDPARGKELLVNAAKRNDQLALAICVQSGFGDYPVDVDRSIAILTEIVNTSVDPVAQFYLGLGYERKGNVKEAVRCYRLAAELHDPSAQHKLGEAYRLGRGVKQDKERAKTLFQIAADQGHADALCDLGDLHHNATQAVSCFQLASDLGHADAPAKLGTLLEVCENIIDLPRALQLYKLATERGSAEGRYMLGRMYYNGKGVEQDFKIAMLNLEQAAAQGFREAHISLGLIRRSGWGAPKDFDLARVHFGKAIALGSAAVAQRELGLMYYGGEGVPRDKQKAAQLFKLAADQGDAIAQRELGIMHRYGEAVVRDKKKAAELLRQAADGGDAQAQFRFAEMMYEHDGVAEVPADVLKYLRLAAKQHERFALETLGDFYDSGYPGLPADRKLALQYYEEASHHGNLAGTWKVAELLSEEDPRRAFQWYKTAADDEHNTAQVIVADHYALGKIVAKDRNEQIRYHRIAHDWKRLDFMSLENRPIN